MQQIQSSLKKIGLTDTESAIYLTGLAHSSVGVSELMKQTRINRTTIYHALDTLAQKGLVAKKNIGQKMVFSMSKPENIQNLLNEKIESLKQQSEEIKKILPLLRQKKESPENKINVFHYEGIEGVKLAVEEAMYCKSGHWDIIAPVKNFFSEFSKEYAKYFVETRKRRGLTARSLWEESPTHKFLTPTQLNERNPRILPKVMHGKFKSVICLFDDKVEIISSVNELSAIIIQSRELHETLFAIFEGLWISSRKIETKNI